MPTNDTSTDRKLSAASIRALSYTKGPEWFCQFRESDLQGDFAYEEGVIRRDPSAVLLIDGTYFVWYTKGEGETVGFGSGDPRGQGLSLGPDGGLVRHVDRRLGLARAGPGCGPRPGRRLRRPRRLHARDLRPRGQVLPGLPDRQGALCGAREEPDRHGRGRLAPRTVAQAGRADPVAGRQRRVAGRRGRPLQRGHPGRFRQPQGPRSLSALLPGQVLALLQGRAHGRADDLRRARDQVGRGHCRPSGRARTSSRSTTRSPTAATRSASGPIEAALPQC